MESSAQEQPQDARPPRLFGIVFAIALAVFLFGVYPLGLLPQLTAVKVRGFYDGVLFFISVPLMVTLSAVFFMPASFVDTHKYRLPIPIGACSLALAVLTNLPNGWSTLPTYALILGCVTLPYLVLLARGRGWLTQYGVSRVCFIVWTIQVCLGYMAIFHDRPMYGVSANPCWAGIFLVLLSPWAVIGASHKYPKFNKSKWFTIIFGAHVTIMPIVKYHSIGVTLETEPFSFVALVLTLLLIFLFFKLNHRSDRARTVMGCIAIGWSTGYLLVQIVLGEFPMGLHQPFAVDVWHNNLSFGISLPAFLTLGLLAVPVIAANRWRVGISLWIALLVYMVCWLINFPRHLEFVDEFVMVLGCVSIPLAVAILREKKVLTLSRISTVCLLLWMVQVALGFHSALKGRAVIGTPGNPNWMAALLLLLAPWAVAALVGKLEHLRENKWFTGFFLAHAILIPAFFHRTFLAYATARPQALVILFLALALTFAFFKLHYPNKATCWLFATAAVAVPTLYLLLKCNSRAGWVALAGTPVILAFVWFKTPLEKVLYGALLFIAATGILLFFFKFSTMTLVNVVEPDVRLPLWTGTVRMMRDHPIGVRPGEFQRRFVKYRVGTYHSRLVAADMTIHPHNEFLNLGAQLGIPVLIALILMAVPLLRGSFDDPLINLARLSAIAVVIASCFDMPLVQPPISFLGFAMLGLCWPLHILPLKKGSIAKTVGMATLVLAIAGAGVFTWYDLTFDVNYRKATIAKNAANQFKKRNDFGTSIQLARKAYDYNLRAVTPFNSLKATYEAGLLALGRGNAYDEAEALFEKVQALDPDYAHVNMALGQLYFKKAQFAKAGQYFWRECQFYPKNTTAWQSLYSFAFVSGEFGLVQFCDAKLTETYLEKAQRTHRGDRLLAKQRMFLETLVDDKRREETVRRGKELVRNVNLGVIDPLMHVLALGEAWHRGLLEGSFEKFDYFLWLGRYKKYAALRKHFPDFPETPPDVQSLTQWFCKRYTIMDSDDYAIPAATSRVRKGSPISLYACFSDYASITGKRCLLQLDNRGVPECAWVFSGEPNIRFPRDPKTGKIVLVPAVDLSKVNWFKVDLRNGTCKELDEQARKAFKWIPNRTVAYFAPEEYFFRTNILGVIMESEAKFLPTRPASFRLLELFWITGRKVPPFHNFKDYCLRTPLMLYKALFEQSMKFNKSARPGSTNER